MSTNSPGVRVRLELQQLSGNGGQPEQHCAQEAGLPERQEGGPPELRQRTPRAAGHGGYLHTTSNPPRHSWSVKS